MKYSEDKINANSQRIPLPMQYMGGKGRIVENILDGIGSNFDSISNFVDLFAGSGIVSFRAMEKGYQVKANDIQPYSSVILSSLLVSPVKNINSIIQILSKVTDNDLFNNDKKNYLSDYSMEQSFIESLNKENFNWLEYQKFCELTILCDGSVSEINLLKKKEKWTLFLAYYRNTYFGVKQCAEIDFLRELSEQLDKNLKEHLMACVISSLTFCVSSTTHLAQFLKPSNEKNAKHILRRRSISIINAVLIRLQSLTKMNRTKKGKVLNHDFRIALKKFKLDSSHIVYADPPYFKEHYSRYYHILDTFFFYDHPELTFNDRIGKTTIGRYRTNRLISDFGKKSLVRSALEELCESCNLYNNKLAISYSCSSLVEKDFFHYIAENKKLYLKTLDFKLVHTGQGRARHKQVTEYLFLYSNEKI